MEEQSLKSQISTPEDEHKLYFMSLQVCMLAYFMKSKSINEQQTIYLIDLLKPLWPDLSERRIVDNIVSMIIYIEENNSYMETFHMLGAAKILPEHYKVAIIKNTILIKKLEGENQCSLIDIEIIADELEIKGYRRFEKILNAAIDDPRLRMENIDSDHYEKLYSILQDALKRSRLKLMQKIS